MIGLCFGKWIVLRKAIKEEKPQYHRSNFYLCRCNCGNESFVRSEQLKNGRSSGCKECYKIRFKKEVTKHGLHTSTTYNIWRGIKKRCKLPSHPSYKWYGAKGITYCERWEKFENFLEDMGERPKGLQIDRIDTTGNYNKENCRWVTSKENQNNRINNLNRKR